MHKKLTIVVIQSIALPYLQAWVHEFDLYARVGDQAVEAFSDLVETETIHTAVRLTDTIIPCCVFKAFQSAMANIEHNSQVKVNGSLPVVFRGMKRIVEQVFTLLLWNFG